MKKSLLLILFLSGMQHIVAQKFTRKDSLQGGLRFERTCFDVQRYDLNIKVNPEDRSIVGFNDISFMVTSPTKKFNWIYLKI